MRKTNPLRFCEASQGNLKVSSGQKRLHLEFDFVKFRIRSFSNATGHYETILGYLIYLTKVTKQVEMLISK